jgi:hypothetical protein
MHSPSFRKVRRCSWVSSFWMDKLFSLSLARVREFQRLDSRKVSYSLRVRACLLSDSYQQPLILLRWHQILAWLAMAEHGILTEQKRVGQVYGTTDSTTWSSAARDVRWALVGDECGKEDLSEDCTSACRERAPIAPALAMTKVGRRCEVSEVASWTWRREDDGDRQGNSTT